MNDRSASRHAEVTLSISAVERDTGISKDTLRVWERRYGYPKPKRDRFGERAYSLEQVGKLRLLRRLLDQGHRPGRIINSPVEQLLELAEQIAVAPSSMVEVARQQPLDRLLGLVQDHNVDELRSTLLNSMLRLGTERFVIEVVAPLTRQIGEAWVAGRLQILEEHLYTESMQVVLRSAIDHMPRGLQRPNLLLTTLPGEPHGLGLLMAEALLVLEGCQCRSLGSETPVGEIERAVQAWEIDIVALSVTACVGANQILDGLEQLRAGLPSSVDIWVGGHCPVVTRKSPAGVNLVADLAAISSTVAQWRAAHLKKVT